MLLMCFFHMIATQLFEINFGCNFLPTAGQKHAVTEFLMLWACEQMRVLIMSLFPYTTVCYHMAGWKCTHITYCSLAQILKILVASNRPESSTKQTTLMSHMQLHDMEFISADTVSGAEYLHTGCRDSPHANTASRLFSFNVNKCDWPRSNECFLDSGKHFCWQLVDIWHPESLVFKLTVTAIHAPLYVVSLYMAIFRDITPQIKRT
jgi:hypothetical protein